MMDNHERLASSDVISFVTDASIGMNEPSRIVCTWSLSDRIQKVIINE